jgi:GAF domain-containing protein
MSPPDRVAPTLPADIQAGAFEATLTEEALFLQPLSDILAERWSALYLDTFGRSSFFSSQRVEKIFKELVDIFVGCLKERSLDLYFQNLKDRGRFFSRIGVPFEEVIISIHLFEEVCVEQFLESYPNRSKLPKLILALEEVHSQGLAVLASSYFDTVKKEMLQVTESLREENDALKKDLHETKDAFFSHTAKELASMQLMLSGINHKLRKRVVQLSRLQKIADSMEGESDWSQLLKIGSRQLRSILPAGSEVYFAFFDEERKKTDVFHVYDLSGGDSLCDIVSSFYFSELSPAFQNALYDDSRKIAHFKGFADIPRPFLDLLTSKNLREFLLLPVRQFHEALGFILVGAQNEDFISKQNHRLYQRAGQILSKALSHALLFQRSKKQGDFVSLLDEISQRKAGGQPVETVLDFCLGSMIKLLGAERASLMRYDEIAKELRVCAAKGYRVYPISGIPIKWGEGIAGAALKDSKIVSITRMKEPERSKLVRKALRQREAPEAKIKSLLCLPISEGERPLGVLNISTINFCKNFGKSDIEMAHQIASRIAGIVKNL